MNEVEKALAELDKIISRASVSIHFEMWATSNPTAEKLAKEWFDLCDEQRKPYPLDLRIGRNVEGSTVFVVVSDVGHHQSLVSHEAALLELIEAHQTRVEDLGSTRDLIWWANSDAHASTIASAVAEQIRKAKPELRGVDRDPLVLSHIAAAHIVEAATRAMPLDSDGLTALRMGAPEKWATSRDELIKFACIPAGVVEDQAISGDLIGTTSEMTVKKALAKDSVKP